MPCMDCGNGIIACGNPPHCPKMAQQTEAPVELPKGYVFAGEWELHGHYRVYTHPVEKGCDVVLVKHPATRKA